MSGVRQSLMMNDEQRQELLDTFETFDKDGNGFLSMAELGEALKLVGMTLPHYKIRSLIQTFDKKADPDRLSMEEFAVVYANLKKEHDLGHTFRKQVTKKEGIETMGGSGNAAEGTTHSVRIEEQVAFSNWINRNLQDDEDCKKYLPLNPENRDIYVKCADGILLCKMINQSEANTIDDRAINKGKLSIYQIHENLTLALNSSRAIGCNVVNIGPDDLNQGTPHLLLGLLWQIIRIGLLGDINLHENPLLVALLQEGEDPDIFKKLSPEQILIRWVNYHLARSPCGRQISNFQGDIKDSVVYIHLINQISPAEFGTATQCENEPDLRDRAECMLQEADKIGCRSFVAPGDVVSGNYKLNLAFVANLFNTYPALEPREDMDLEVREEPREEKMYRNWMNSLGVSPYVNNVMSDLTDGLIIFQLYDYIKPGVVDWKKVVRKFNRMRMMMEKIANCNYAIELGRELKFSLVGIQGKDIYDGIETLTLGLVWQLMKAYTLAILTKLNDSDKPIVDKEIVMWANNKLSEARKPDQVTSFSDPIIGKGRVIADLIDTIKQGSINYSLLTPGETDEGKLANAKYVISIARKIGARVYALPEDIVEVKAKMVMTIFACLMIRDLQAPEKTAS